jgi:hypothetical protein
VEVDTSAAATDLKELMKRGRCMHVRICVYVCGYICISTTHYPLPTTHYPLITNHYIYHTLHTAALEDRKELEAQAELMKIKVDKEDQTLIMSQV